MRANEFIKEEATAGATSASMMASISSVVGGKRKINKTGRYGAPKAPQKLNADGTAVNALDMKNNVMNIIRNPPAKLRPDNIFNNNGGFTNLHIIEV